MYDVDGIALVFQLGFLIIGVPAICPNLELCGAPLTMFLNNLDDFQIAMKMYTLADKPISQVKLISASLDVLFQVKDTWII